MALRVGGPFWFAIVFYAVIFLFGIILGDFTKGSMVQLILMFTFGFNDVSLFSFPFENGE